MHLSPTLTEKLRHDPMLEKHVGVKTAGSCVLLVPHFTAYCQSVSVGTFATEEGKVYKSIHICVRL